MDSPEEIQASAPQPTPMGLRNAVVRKLAVPDITTTVLTITGLAADAPIVGGAGTRSGRKLLSIAAMLMGALVGTLMLKWGFAAPLALAAGLACVASFSVVRQLKTLAAASVVADGPRA